MILPFDLHLNGESLSSDGNMILKKFDFLNAYPQTPYSFVVSFSSRLEVIPNLFLVVKELVKTKNECIF